MAYFAVVNNGEVLTVNSSDLASKEDFEEEYYKNRKKNNNDEITQFSNFMECLKFCNKYTGEEITKNAWQEF